jgi:phosphoglycolate phosphatase-like HAD superfamily hydrolase
MIGDSNSDIESGKNAGCKVSYLIGEQDNVYSIIRKLI